MGMFDLSTKGFKQVFADRSISRMIEELVANAFDENVTKVDVTFEHLGRQEYRLKVVDDSPSGFADLRDAYTVFAPSKKKEDPTKRGRFCFGEKWVIARCQEVIITSTGGRVIFDVANDKRSRSPKATEQGTIVECRLKSTNEEYAKACERLRHILVPERITLAFNGQILPSRSPVRTAEASLPTEYADENGDLRRTERKTRIDIYEVHEGETAGIFELGIPVVETGDVSAGDAVGPRSGAGQGTGVQAWPQRPGRHAGAGGQQRCHRRHLYRQAGDAGGRHHHPLRRETLRH